MLENVHSTRMAYCYKYTHMLVIGEETLSKMSIKFANIATWRVASMDHTTAITVSGAGLFCLHHTTVCKPLYSWRRRRAATIPNRPSSSRPFIPRCLFGITPDFPLRCNELKCFNNVHQRQQTTHQCNCSLLIETLRLLSIYAILPLY